LAEIANVITDIDFSVGIEGGIPDGGRVARSRYRLTPPMPRNCANRLGTAGKTLWYSDPACAEGQRNGPDRPLRAPPR